MVGPALDAQGGIASVLQAYREAGLFERCGIRYLCSYEGAGLLRQLRVFGLTLARLLLALLRGEVALLHLHTASRGSFWRKSLLAAMARLFGVPYLLHVHSGELLDHYQRRWPSWQRAWARRCLLGAARVVLLTPGWQQAFEAALPGLRGVVLRNPVAVPAGPRPTAGPRHVLLFLGRLTALKGAPTLLRAFALLHRSQPQARLLLAGPGDRAAMQALMQELGLPAEAVSLPGWIAGEAKAQALREAGCFVLPSQAEGLPVSVLEAMAAGLAVVATRVGGLPELIDEGRTGLLVPVDDAPALAEALLSLIEQPARAEALADAAFAAVQQHALPAVAAALLAIYRELGLPR